jgi:plastocyanin
MRTRLLVGVGLVAMLVAGCSDSSTPSSPSPSTTGGGGGGLTSQSQIKIVGGGTADAFQPSATRATAGIPVQWINFDSEAHDVRATDGSFDTGVLQPDDVSGSIVVSASGAHYYCTIHTGEVGVIASASGVVPPCTGQYCGS